MTLPAMMLHGLGAFRHLVAKMMRIIVDGEDRTEIEEET